MAVWSIVDFDKMQKAGRWDTEYFQPVYLQVEQKLKSRCSQAISDIARIEIEKFDPDDVENFDYIEISGVDLNTGAITPERLLTGNTPDRAQFVMAGGEILVSTVRPNRSSVGIVPFEGKGATLVASSGFAPLVANSEELRALLFVWLKTKYATDWLDRHTTASMYPAVSVSDILTTPIPKLRPETLAEVKCLFDEMQTTLEQGRTAYPEAESELLERLGWQELAAQPKELYYIADSDEMARAGRCDPEHFQPQYARLRRRIMECGGMKLGQGITEMVKGTQPEIYDEAGQAYVVKSKNVFGRGVDWNGCDHCPASTWYRNPMAQLQTDDIVINATGRGTLGRAAALTSVPEKAIAAVDIVICRPNHSVLNPVYLALFLNSPAGLAQSEQWQTGSSGQLHLYPEHFDTFVVFVPRNDDGTVDIAWQQRLADKVQEASAAKERAQEKLNAAKQLVETAIEDSEAAGLAILEAAESS